MSDTQGGNTSREHELQFQPLTHSELDIVTNRVRREIPQMAEFVLNTIANRFWEEFLINLSDVVREESAGVCDCITLPRNRPNDFRSGELLSGDTNDRDFCLTCYECHQMIYINGSSAVHRICRNTARAYRFVHSAEMRRLTEEMGGSYLRAHQITS